MSTIRMITQFLVQPEFVNLSCENSDVKLKSLSKYLSFMLLLFPNSFLLWLMSCSNVHSSLSKFESDSELRSNNMHTLRSTWRKHSTMQLWLNCACAVLYCALKPCLANLSQSVLSLVDYSKALSISFNKPGANYMGPFKFWKWFVPQLAVSLHEHNRGTHLHLMIIFPISQQDADNFILRLTKQQDNLKNLTCIYRTVQVCFLPKCF